MLERLKAEGQDPPALRRRVVVDGKLLYYRQVFSELADSRSYSPAGTPLPIPVSEYVSFCELFRIYHIEERERIFRYVRALDRTYVEFMIEKHQREAAAKDKKPKSAVSRK